MRVASPEAAAAAAVIVAVRLFLVSVRLIDQ